MSDSEIPPEPEAKPTLTERLDDLEKKLADWSDKVRRVSRILTVIGFAIGLAYFAIVGVIFPALTTSAIWLVQNVPPVVFAIVAVPLGVGLRLFKKKVPIAYGVIEIVAGAVTVHYAVIAAKPEPALRHLLTVLGGLYLIVRGTDNIANGLPPMPEGEFVMDPKGKRVYYRRKEIAKPEPVKPKRRRVFD